MSAVLLNLTIWDTPDPPFHEKQNECRAHYCNVIVTGFCRVLPSPDAVSSIWVRLYKFYSNFTERYSTKVMSSAINHTTVWTN